MRKFHIILFFFLVVFLSCCDYQPIKESATAPSPPSGITNTPDESKETLVDNQKPTVTLKSELNATHEEKAQTNERLPDSDLNAPYPTLSLEEVETIGKLSSGEEVQILWVQMFSETEGWSLATNEGGGDHHLLYTSDGGVSWEDRSPPQPDMEESQVAIANFIDLVHGWVVYTPFDPQLPLDQVYVWRTSDGGGTWLPSNFLDRNGLAESFYPSRLQFTDPLNGWLLVHVGVGMNHDYIALYQTKDGGVSWMRIQDPFVEDSSIQACLKTGMQFTDPDHGWLTGDCSGVAVGALLFRSDDGGLSWDFVQLPEPLPGIFSEGGPACGTYSPVFLDTQKGHLVVRCIIYEGETITGKYFGYKTEDSGKTWLIEPFPGGELIMVDELTRWGMGRDQYQTMDGGENWEMVSQVDWDGRFIFLNSQIGWASARWETKYGLLKTQDGARNWILMKPIIR
jgi:photosystem II stability/assembly factor-like uncharacterized protein